MVRGAVLFLAVVAALLGAPQPVGAAANTLTPLAPTPSSGTTLTAFTFRTQYDGRFDAIAVVVEVAQLALPMQLVAGTPASGTWAVSSVLPQGTWSPTYRAVVAQGSAPTVTGPPISVTGIAPPAPATVAPTASPPPGNGPGPARTPDDAAPHGPSVPSSVVPAASTSAEGAPGTGPAASSTTGPPAGAPPATPPVAPRHGVPTPAAAGAARPAGSGPGAGPSAAIVPAATIGAVASPAAVPAATRRPADSASPATIVDPPAAGDDLRGMTPAATVALVLIASAALIGTFVMLMARRRTPEPWRVESASARRARSMVAPSEAAAGDATAELLDRRARRRAHVVLPADPIVAALGIEDPVEPAAKAGAATTRTAAGSTRNPRGTSRPG
jgi:hypothetical protein